MLQTIWECAAEQLAESDEAATVERQHTRFFLMLAAEPQLKGRQQLEWIERLETEHDNLRAVLQRARLFGAVATLRKAIGALVWPSGTTEYERNAALVRAQLDAPTFAAAWAEGQMMTLASNGILTLPPSSADGLVL
jgi:hypothetical protein